MKKVKTPCASAIAKVLSAVFILLLAYGSIAAQARSAKSRGGGGAKKSSAVSKPSANRQSTGNRDRNSNISNSGNRTNNIGSNNNKVNIDNSKKNVNVNVDNSKNIRVNNSRNTSVRRNNYRPYGRPPYRYGGHSYYCYHPYHYHPYRPFYWGPVWHPWGFFIAALATTAIIVSVNNQQYHYDQGVYYMAGNGGYTVVSAPVGATVEGVESVFKEFKGLIDRLRQTEAFMGIW